MTTKTLNEIAQFLGAKLVGDGSIVLSGIATLQQAKTGQISFLANPVYAKYLPITTASAVILDADNAKDSPVPCLVVENPYLCYARLTELFALEPKKFPGIHPSAVVDPSASIHSTSSIGPNCSIAAGVSVAENVQLGAGCVLGEDSTIGNGCHLHANVTVYHGVSIGRRVIIHSGAVIGSDGFGFARSGSEWVKIHQIGGVQIGDDVEIGAGTTIDRGALDNTSIATGVKVDNQVQIAHNVKIGENTAIAACVGIAGSTTIGKNCTIAGAVGIIGHLDIVDNVHVTAMSLVTKSITQPGVYSSGTPIMPSKEWRKNAVRFSQLESLNSRVNELEKKPPT